MLHLEESALSTGVPKRAFPPNRSLRDSRALTSQLILTASTGRMMEMSQPLVS